MPIDYAAEFLSQLELRESELLSWGLTDGSFTVDEIDQYAEEFFDEHDLYNVWDDSYSLIQQLLARKLIFCFDDGTSPRYRTRMAEGIRLFANLRQLFPKHFQDNNRKWQAARTIVADYRLLIRNREVPCRKVEASRVEQEICVDTNLSTFQREVLAESLDARSTVPWKLAPFQVRSTRSILARLQQRRTVGTIICAGTGSGKTLSFYLPALIHIAENIDGSYWPRCLAIYPRNELLKDQLSETYQQVRRLDAILQRNGRRKILLGTFFVDTIERASYLQYEDSGWERVGDHYACPYLRCPQCDGEMLWRSEDSGQNIERLCCGNDGCDVVIESDELVLTRDRLLKTPPDILFTTTEMLNQRLGDSKYCKLFGVSTSHAKKPSLVLLDEVHTYEGTSGAQVALLLRRWQHLSKAKPHFVGLSATLRNASYFFSRLVGVEEYLVSEIAPNDDEMEYLSMEYMLALRNDPASRTSVVSTTIQTVMLMRRLLDPSHNDVSQAQYGKRVFVFADDLDVINRLFFKIRDAEGQNFNGLPDLQMHPGGSLANLRNVGLPDAALRFNMGQSWDMCEQIGHRLSGAPLNIRRTTSQDQGVDTATDIIVATASLEVGFNDPDVNAVIQHKAPRGAAQFLQRKGRAGRKTSMRPWTIVVLSDVGRDRMSWQKYDLLFDPELPPRDLPIDNIHVLRMQATFCLIEWIGKQRNRGAGLPHGSVWQDLSGPAEARYKNITRIADAEKRRIDIAEFVRQMLEDEAVRDEFNHYLQSALRQTKDVIDLIFWHPPRALITHVLPTILRRLETNWGISAVQGNSEPTYDTWSRNNPLPEFITANLFGDLNLPEVSVRTPQVRGSADFREDMMPVLQAMKEYSPGRVSLRFGIHRADIRHWTPVPDIYTTGQQQLPVERFLSSYNTIGTFQYYQPDDDTACDISVARPLEMRPSIVPDQVTDSSNSRLSWHSQLIETGEGIEVDTPNPSRWDSLIREIRFFTHNNQCPIEVRRFATGCDVTLRLQTTQEIESHVAFIATEPGEARPEPMAVGFQINVDGFAVRFTLPEDLHLEQEDMNSAKSRALRCSRYRDLLKDDVDLDGIANIFERDDLANVFLSALAQAATTHRTTLSETHARVVNDEVSLEYQAVLNALLQSIVRHENEDDDTNGFIVEADERLEQDRYQRLTELLGEPTVINTLRRHATVLWEAPNSHWTSWLNEKFKVTLGAAILDAVEQLCSDLDTTNLVLDIDSGPKCSGDRRNDSECEELWITEDTVGGGGVIESVLRRYAADPRRFFGLVESALQASELEVTDNELYLFLTWATDPNDEVYSALQRLRDTRSESSRDYAVAFRCFKGLLAMRGLYVCHSVMTSIASRILRPGSSAETDRLLKQLLDQWKATEDALGIDVDIRIFSFMKCEDNAIDNALDNVFDNIGYQDTRQWRVNAINSILWPRGVDIRTQRLRVYSRFGAFRETEHDLVRDCLRGTTRVVDIDDADWMDQALEILETGEEVMVAARSVRAEDLKRCLTTLLCTPVDVGPLILYPRLCGSVRSAGTVQACVDLAGAIQ